MRFRPEHHGAARRTPGWLFARAGRVSGGGAPSFTLIEVMIAVGAVALIGVALASVFSQTSRTITVGKRVSALNAYASMLEQQMRLDFSRISRDGYLLIHNQLADSNRIAGFQYNGPAGVNAPGVQDVVALHADDLSPRPRRIDEVMFFVEGDAFSAREPLSSTNLARGNASRIVYGHGKRRIADETSQTSFYLLPRLDDLMSGPTLGEPEANLGVAPPAIPITVTNPNRYASDWTLLRHVTVLAPPRSTTMTYQNVVGNLTNAELTDRDEQVGFQPAASNLFRALAAILPDPNQEPAPSHPFGDAIRGTVRPQFSSGLVDLATTSLAEVRSIVTTADTWPGAVPTGAAGQPASIVFFNPADNASPDGQNQGPDGKFRIHGPGAGQDGQLIWRTQAWMMEGLPAWSHATDPDDRTRVRCEPQPPAYLAPTDPTHPAYPPPLDHYLRYAGRADQLMLSSSNFLPRCTEFIVEWSFGVSYPSDPGDPNYRAGREGEVIWHGMARREDGVPIQPPPTPQGLENNAQLVAQPYNPDTADVQLFGMKYRRIDGSMAAYPDPGVASEVRLATELIHGQGVALPYVPPAGAPIVSYFGYFDPTFDPDRSGGGYGDPTDSASTTIPWAWPRLVRVTIGLADPTDPSVEQRFQFVFELPPNQEP